METLSLDFNRRDAQGRVSIGPEAEKRLLPTLRKLYVEDRVLVVDDEGNQCEGVLEQTNMVAHDGRGGAHFRCVVRLDLATWRDRPTETASATAGQTEAPSGSGSAAHE